MRPRRQPTPSLAVLLTLLWAGTIRSQAPPGARIQRISVLGERHSGTNYVRQMLGANLLGYRKGAGYGDAFTGTLHRVMGAKHCYAWPIYPGWRRPTTPVPSALAAMKLKAGEVPDHLLERFSRVLAIVVFRNPWDWAISMKKDCWCQEKDMLASLSFEQFLNTSIIDNCAYLGDGGKAVLTPGRCQSFLSCRAKKYRSYFALKKWAPNVEFIRHEDIASPEQGLRWLTQLVQKYDLPNNGTLRHWTAYKDIPHQTFDMRALQTSSPFYNPKLLTSNETVRLWVEAVNSHMDVETERQAGYERLVIPTGSAPSLKLLQ